MTQKLRLDQLLVETGRFESRARARAAIEAGLVRVEGALARKPAQPTARDARIEAEAPHPYVSRGGVKLAAALDAFAIDPAGLVALDVGASTGGFTDVLLRRGARLVPAVDVGRGQLHPAIAARPEVLSREATDIRSLEALDPPPALAVIDVSFIGLRLVLPAVARLLAPAATIVALVKPQFELGRAALRDGVVRDRALAESALPPILDALAALGFAPIGGMPSPIEGGEGNAEFLAAGRRR
jgi:23S rRNA (cytidine1920-2'-O)/16S rRNA (cytidine1409-2'-O)-methyltransferase